MPTLKLFATEQERQMPPEVRLLPKAIWKAYFHHSLTDIEQGLLTAKTPQEISNILQSPESKKLSQERKRCCWLILLYHMDGFDESLLKSTAEILGLNLSEWILEDHALLWQVSASVVQNPNAFAQLTNLLLSKKTANAQLINTAKAVFQQAASTGNLKAIEYLLLRFPAQVNAFISFQNYQAFRNIVKNGHLPALNYILDKAPEKFAVMLSTLNYDDISTAALKGNHTTLERLFTKSPDLILSKPCAVFATAAAKGHLVIIEKLIELAPDRIQEMIAASNFSAFGGAAANGHLHVIEKLIKLAPNHIQEMIEARDFAAFREAAEKGHLHVIEKLIELAPDRIQEMIAASRFYAFRLATANGHIHVIKKLIELAPDRIQEMIAASNFAAFRSMTRHNIIYATTWLKYPNVFAYAEMHQQEYGEMVQLFIQKTLAQLREEQAQAIAENENAVFNVSDGEQAKQCFYMLRNLIRRNDAQLLDDIRLLMDIPSVKALLHTAVTPNQPNELVRLALSLGNRNAAALLLNVPAVRQLAEQNDFYRQEVRGGFDLRALAQDRESSMTALTAEEQKRLKGAIEHYQPLIQQAGVSNLMQDLRETLERRYAAHPASITREDGSLLTLPFEWRDFQALALTPEEKKQAFQAYFQNKNHTAFRYLSRPNFWMANNASYVNISEDRVVRWSTFAEYQPVISMLYLAAQDENYPAIDSFTIETRIEHFIDELAHIGRAHNWDNKRIRNGVEEEYDDLQGDKPSCFSGVKRRLFQSVMGHPLLKMLTLGDIKQELRDFMRAHFKQCITDNNREPLGEAWAKFIGAGDHDDCWKALDVSPEDQTQFIDYLAKKYKAQFTDSPSFIDYIRESFTITPIYPSHVVRFAGETRIDQFLPFPAQKTEGDDSIDEAKNDQEPASIEWKRQIATMKHTLQSCGHLGHAMIGEIECLENGMKSSWPIWEGADKKLSQVITILKTMPSMTEGSLQEALREESALYQALLQKPAADKTYRAMIQELLIPSDSKQNNQVSP